jgi:hypothetical protein
MQQPPAPPHADPSRQLRYPTAPEHFCAAATDPRAVVMAGDLPVLEGTWIRLVVDHQIVWAGTAR